MLLGGILRATVFPMKPDDLRFDHDKDRLSSKAMTMGSVPIGSAHDARHADRFRRRYRCASCAFEVDVVVFGTGTGRSVSPLFLDNEEAAGRAEVRASRNAAKEAAQSLKLFPCPRCGRRDATTFVVKSIFQLLAVSGLFCGLAVLSSNAADTMRSSRAGRAPVFGVASLHVRCCTAPRRSPEAP